MGRFGDMPRAAQVALCRIRHLIQAAKARESDTDAARAQVESVRDLVAREACARARLALAQGDDTQAAHHLQHAAGIRKNHPDVIELQARLALDQRKPAAALAQLERLARPNARHRLLLQYARLQTGQRAMAQLDLHAWSRQADCPSAARVMLAWLQWKAGDASAARDTLRRNDRLCPDADSLRLRMLIEIESGNRASIQRIAARLRLRHGHDPMSRRFLKTQHATRTEDDAQPTVEMIDELAPQLADQPRLISTLLAAQRLSPRPGRIELLRRAIGRIVDEIDQPLIAIEAMAELAMLADDADDARRWARRGLRSRPYSVRLALLMDDLPDESNSEMVTVQSTTVLRQVADDHPEYADVQRRLVLRYEGRGLRTLARRRLRRWMRRSPDHPLAIQTQKDLAA